MNENKIVRIFNDSVDEINRKKIDFIKKNKDVNEYLTKVSKVSIQLAKIKLNKKFENKKDDLKKELDSLINNNKLYEKSNSIKNKCFICKDKGIFNGKTCKCFENLAKYKRLEVLNEYLPLSNFKFENFDLNLYSNKIVDGKVSSEKELMTKTLNFCKEYAENFKINSQSLLMIGNTGVGKTHISAAIASTILMKNFSVMYVSLPNLIQDLEGERFNRSHKLSQEDVLKCDFLVLDDLGSEFINNFSISVIYNILNIRILKNLSTVISTNLNFDELEKKYGVRIVSRIIGHFLSIQFYGSDMRQRMGRMRVNSIKEKKKL